MLEQWQVGLIAAGASLFGALIGAIAGIAGAWLADKRRFGREDQLRTRTELSELAATLLRSADGMHDLRPRPKMTDEDADKSRLEVVRLEREMRNCVHRIQLLVGPNNLWRTADEYVRTTYDYHATFDILAETTGGPLRDLARTQSQAASLFMREIRLALGFVESAAERRQWWIRSIKEGKPDPEPRESILPWKRRL